MHLIGYFHMTITAVKSENNLTPSLVGTKMACGNSLSVKKYW